MAEWLYMWGAFICFEWQFKMVDWWPFLIHLSCWEKLVTKVKNEARQFSVTRCDIAVLHAVIISDHKRRELPQGFSCTNSLNVSLSYLLLLCTGLQLHLWGRVTQVPCYVQYSTIKPLQFSLKLSIFLSCALYLARRERLKLSWGGK